MQTKTPGTIVNLTEFVPFGNGPRSRPARFHEAADTSPAIGRKAAAEAEDGIKTAFHKLISDVVDSIDSIPNKLRRIEKLLTELENDRAVIRSGGTPVKRASKATEAFVSKLIGKKKYTERLLENRKATK